MPLGHKAGLPLSKKFANATAPFLIPKRMASKPQPISMPLGYKAVLALSKKLANATAPSVVIRI